MKGYADIPESLWEKMDLLLDAEGYDPGDDGLLLLGEDRATDSLIPAICTNDECDYVCDYEPDQTEGWCEECGTGTCRSFLSLWGII